MANAFNDDDRLPLRAEQRSVADARIVQGAMAVIAEKGLDATVDDVALAAGVSRRTVFRHFATYGELLAAAIARGFVIYEEEIARLASLDAGSESWLPSTAATIHEMHQRLQGRAFWDLHAQRSSTPPEVLTAMAERYSERIQWWERLANAAWQGKGGEGPAPRWVKDSFAVLLSVFATAAMGSFQVGDQGALAARILSAVLSDAVAEQQADARNHEAVRPRS